MKKKVSLPISFFGVKSPWDIRWAHAVNNLERLEQYCKSPKTMMIEGDISSRGENIVMAHDPNQKADITFDIWIEKIATSKKGAKLDFKDPLAISYCLKKLQKLGLENPIFLNADILQGPGGRIPKFEPIEFIELCKKYYPKGILSIGWTTGYLPNAKYTKHMIHEMFEIVKDFDYLITFPIRACYTRSSYSELQMLLQKLNHTLTIWNSEPVSDDLKRWIKDNFDHCRAFYDLIDEKGNPIYL
ncbi:DUF2181 domain-containing protein [Patescibacteria group bacterium]|nr:DUF2181 domain-containing protein [Patescibacteria group bacterium]